MQQKKLKKFVNIKNSLNYIDMGIKQCVSNIWWKLSMPFNVFFLFDSYGQIFLIINKWSYRCKGHKKLLNTSFKQSCI